MDKKTLQKTFRYINERLFDNLLDEPEFYLYDYDECMAFDTVLCDGMFLWQENLIAIWDETNIFDTMVHEMIHLWQFQNNKYMGHEGWFRIWCEKAIEEFYYKKL